MKTYHFLTALLLAGGASCGVSAESMDDFFAKNPSLNSNAEVRLAIKQRASILQFQESSSTGRYDANDAQKLMSEYGYQYASLALRQLATDCRNGNADYNGTPLARSSCSLLINEADKTDENKQVAIKIIDSIVKSLSKSCVLFGKGEDEKAKKVISDTTFPGGEKMPQDGVGEFANNFKIYVMQYRNLNEENCARYSQEFLSEAAKRMKN